MVYNYSSVQHTLFVNCWWLRPCWHVVTFVQHNPNTAASPGAVGVQALQVSYEKGRPCSRWQSGSHLQDVLKRREALKNKADGCALWTSSHSWRIWVFEHNCKHPCREDLFRKTFRRCMSAHLHAKIRLALSVEQDCRVLVQFAVEEDDALQFEISMAVQQCLEMHAARELRSLQAPVVCASRTASSPRQAGTLASAVNDCHSKLQLLLLIFFLWPTSVAWAK